MIGSIRPNTLHVFWQEIKLSRELQEKMCLREPAMEKIHSVYNYFNEGDGAVTVYTDQPTHKSNACSKALPERSIFIGGLIKCNQTHRLVDNRHPSLYV